MKPGISNLTDIADTARPTQHTPSLRDRITARAKAIGITGPQPLILRDEVA